MVDLVNDVLSKKKHFNPQGWEPFGEALREANVSQDLIGHRTAGDTSLRPKKHRDLANDNRAHPLLDRTPQKHRETEGKKSRTGSTFNTEVKTTKGQL